MAYSYQIRKLWSNSFSYPEPFLRAVRRGAVAKSISELASDWLVLTQDIVFLLTMFLWYPVMDLARAPRRAPLTARKKGSGYENGSN
jgi:hypothetical protein